jgi:hypothetical protein
MIYRTYENADDWGMVDYCFTHMIDNQIVVTMWAKNTSEYVPQWSVVRLFGA